MNKKIVLSITLVAILASNTVNASWSIQSLGTLGATSSGAADINNTGQVVGYIFNYPDINGFVTGINGEGMTTLGGLGDRYSNASAINNSGQVVGLYDYDNNGNIIFHAYITGPNAVGMTDLGTLGGIFSYANGINDSGQVVGSSIIAGDKYVEHAFITGPNGVEMTDLGTLDGGDTSVAVDINNSGQVVGVSYTGNSPRAFITGPNGVGMTDLGTLVGKENIYASGINDSGQVIGTSGNHLGEDSRAFITGENGVGMIDLGTMGGTWSGASGINNLGQVIGLVGYGEYGSNPYSFVYSDGVMVNLSYLDVVVEAGWTGLIASAINDNGQIVGQGFLNGIYQAFLLTGADDEEFFRNYVAPPIPEPSTYAMLLAGLGLVGFMARRRR